MHARFHLCLSNRAEIALSKLAQAPAVRDKDLPDDLSHGKRLGDPYGHRNGRTHSAHSLKQILHGALDACTASQPHAMARTGYGDSTGRPFFQAIRVIDKYQVRP
jgi:hypothetical protein